MLRQCLVALAIYLSFAADAVAGVEQCEPAPPFACRSGRVLIFLTASGMRATMEDGMEGVTLDSDYPPSDIVSNKFLTNYNFSIVVEGRLCLTMGEYQRDL